MRKEYAIQFCKRILKINAKPFNTNRHVVSIYNINYYNTKGVFVYINQVSVMNKKKKNTFVQTHGRINLLVQFFFPLLLTLPFNQMTYK